MPQEPWSRDWEVLAANVKCVGVPNRLVVAPIAVAVVGLASGPFFRTFWSMERGIRAGEQRLRRLLLETDFETLLKACDDLSQRVADPNYREWIDTLVENRREHGAGGIPAGGKTLQVMIPGNRDWISIGVS